MKIIKKTFAALIMTFLFVGILAFPALAAAHPDRVVDSADLLSSGERSKLTEYLDDISREYEVDVCVVTVESFDESSVTDAADDFYDYNGYGLGDDDSGVMLYISMEDRDYWITTAGSAIDIFSDSDISDIGDEMLSDLSSGNYYEAFSTYADLCYEQIKDYNTYHWFFYLIISVVVGFVAAFIYVAILKSRLKSVAPVDTAANYIVQNSMNVTGTKEFFLYKNLHVTKRESSSNSSSSTHRSSSGRTHGGGGGKF